MITHKKAQIKMGETIAIMFVFFILLVIGAVFYMNIQRTSVSREITAAYDLRSVEISQVISYLPEAQCTDFNVVRPSCFDIQKLIAISEMSGDPVFFDIYSREFEYSKISLSVVYPFNAQWVLYDRSDIEFTSAPMTSIPIAVYNTTSDEYYFGVLEIVNYQGVRLKGAAS
jgi:hypothetical protein